MTDKPLYTALRLYEKGWAIAMPLLRLSSRLREGFAQRMLETPLPGADIWIQAASGGEAYLAWTLLENLRPKGALRVLVTTNTRQGMDIIGRAAAALAHVNPALTLFPAWFPFDRPSIMAAAVSRVNPKLAVLLESELWPGFMYALKKRQCPIFIINGRMTPKSLSAYRKFPGACKILRPDLVLAVSREDAHRFETVFGRVRGGVMNNIKFDSVTTDPTDIRSEKSPGLIKQLIPTESPFLVLGSIRREEEAKIVQIIQKIYEKRPDVITGLFPRHMERLDYWKKTLSGLGLHWHLRSRMEKPLQGGDIILWDVFGELVAAYAAATAVFVGGSLAPLGGQNYLEPLACGTAPVIGPSYENFSWIGEEIFRRGLVIKTRNAKEAAGAIIRQLDNPVPRRETASKAKKFIAARQGGARKACEVIEKTLGDQKNAA